MTVTTTAAKPAPVPRNGVDTPTLFATINAVGSQPELAKFRFRTSNRWRVGTHSIGRVESFSGAGGEHAHLKQLDYDMDHPAVLVGKDNGPTPVEMLLIGLAGCLTAGIANVAAARGVTLWEVTSTVEGDVNMLGMLGLSKTVRNGYEAIRVNISIKGDAPDDTLRKIVEQSRDRSAVFDVLANGTKIDIDVNAK